MNQDKFTQAFLNALSGAQTLALTNDNQYIEPEHVLSTMLNQKEGSVLPLFRQCRANIAVLNQKVGEAIEKIGRASCRERV